MRKDVKIFIGDDLLDITSARALKLALSFSISDIMDINVIKKSTSKTITLPGTKNNEKLLGFGTDVNSAEPVNQSQRPEARIEVAGTLLMKGFLKVTDRIKDRNDKVKAYKIVIVGDNGDWKERLAELNLRDLDLTDQDHVYNKANIDTSETVDASRLYVYPLINYGRFDNAPAVSVSDRYPAFNIKKLLDKILNGIGFSLTSSFFNDTWFSKLYMPFVNEFFQHPESFIDDKIFRVGLLQDTEIFKSNYESAFPFGSPISDAIFRQLPLNDEVNGGNFDAGNNYDTTLLDVNIKDITFLYDNRIEYSFDGSPDLSTVIEHGYLKIENAINSSNNGYFRIVLIDDSAKKVEIINRNRSGATDDETSSSATGNITQGNMDYIVNYPVRQKFICEMLIYWATGDTVQLEVRIMKNDTILLWGATKAFGGLGNRVVKVETPFYEFDTGDKITVIVRSTKGVYEDLIIKSSGTFLYNEVSREIVPNQSYPLADQLPDITQLDFIQGIRDVINAFFDGDIDSRNILSEPRDDFYLATDQSINWTNKLDKSKSETIIDLNQELAKKIIYRYANDSNDAPVNAIEEVTGEPFASVEIENPNKFVKGETELGTTLFAPTLMDKAIEIGFITALLPKMWSDNPEFPDVPDKSTNFLPRILYYAGVESMPTGEKWTFEGGLRTDYPNFYFVDEINDNDNSLRFDDTRRSNGLYEKFYRGYQKTSDEGILYSAYFTLNDRDISNINYRKPIFVKDTYYYLNKINNYLPLENQATLVELIKAIDIRQIAKIITEAEDPKIFPGDPYVKINPGKPGIFLDKNKNLSFIGGINNNSNGYANTQMFGKNLIAGKDGQILLGEYNVENDDALLIVGGGTISERKNLLVIDSNGNFLIGGGSEVLAVINGIIQQVYYTNTDSFAQKVLYAK